MLSYSSENIYKSKAKGRVSGFPRMVCLSFIEKMYEKSDAENRCG
jgi:hypothetical protein